MKLIWQSWFLLMYMYLDWASMAYCRCIHVVVYKCSPFKKLFFSLHLPLWPISVSSSIVDFFPVFTYEFFFHYHMTHLLTHLNLGSLTDILSHLAISWFQYRISRVTDPIFLNSIQHSTLHSIQFSTKASDKSSSTFLKSGSSVCLVIILCFFVFFVFWGFFCSAFS